MPNTFAASTFAPCSSSSLTASSSLAFAATCSAVAPGVDDEHVGAAVREAAVAGLVAQRRLVLQSACSTFAPRASSMRATSRPVCSSSAGRSPRRLSGIRLSSIARYSGLLPHQSHRFDVGAALDQLDGRVEVPVEQREHERRHAVRDRPGRCRRRLRRAAATHATQPSRAAYSSGVKPPVCMILMRGSAVTLRSHSRATPRASTVGAVLEQHADHRRAASAPRPTSTPIGRRTLPSRSRPRRARAAARAVVDVARARDDHQHGLAFRVRRLDVGARVEQRLDHRVVGFDGGRGDRASRRSRWRAFGIRAALEQRSTSSRSPWCAAQMQRRRAVGGALVRRRRRRDRAQRRVAFCARRARQRARGERRSGRKASARRPRTRRELRGMRGRRAHAQTSASSPVLLPSDSTRHAGALEQRQDQIRVRRVLRERRGAGRP